jgi:NADPH-dependent glutamate synthase beta subunit-like oxidoreductase
VPATYGITKLAHAPCRMACPAEINVQGYVQLVKVGKFDEAVKLIMERLPLPGVWEGFARTPAKKNAGAGNMTSRWPSAT